MTEELIEYIALQTELDWKPQSDNKRRSLRERLEDEKGETDERLLVELSKAGRPLWELYWTIRSSKRGGLGSESIAFPDILAYSQLMRHPIAPSEVETLIAMDLKRDEVTNEFDSKQRKRDDTARRLDSVQSGKAGR